MSMVQEKQNTKLVQKQEKFEVKPNRHHDRMVHIELNRPALREFFAAVSDVDSQRLQYVPFMRFIIAGKMRELFGQSFEKVLRGIIHDRQTGAFTIGVQGETTDSDDFVKFGTAISHLIGTPNFDAMSGTYYARFTVKDTDNSDSYLRQAYRTFTLHTDGTYLEEQTDWLLMMKMDERNAVGGESRLLHLDDWEELEKFSKHPLAAHKYCYRGSASKNEEKVVYRPTFYEFNNAPCMSFIDQFPYPENIEQAVYLKELSESMEQSAGTVAFPLPVGELVMANNMFWLHGRAAFEKHLDLHRELMRQRGIFARV